jgi:hypothetical protein
LKVIGLIQSSEVGVIEQLSNSTCANHLRKIADVLQAGDGHFVWAVDGDNNWIAYITLDQDAAEAEYPYLGTGDSAWEALDNMLKA